MHNITEFVKNNKVLAGVGVITIIIIVVALTRVTGGAKNQSGNESVLENEPTIAMVDSSVIVTVKPSTKKGEVEIEIKNAPAGTKQADIEMSYNRKPQATDDIEGAESIPDGILSTCEFAGNSRNCKKDGITLGTCSSGVCRYHQLAGPASVTIRFSGTYGEKLFEKQYEL